MGNTATTPDTKATTDETPSSENTESLRHMNISFLKKRKISGHGALRIVYVILCALLILISIAMIAVTIATAITLKLFTSDQSGRLVAMIILAVISAVILSISIYALIASLKKHNKPVHAASITLIILAIIQAVVVGISVPVTFEDENHLTSSMIASFRQGRVNPDKAKIWANIQSSLICCGVISPEDYRLLGSPDYAPPNVPISCCPSYDSSRSEIVQRREKEACRGRREYYDVGCSAPVVATYRNTAHIVLSVAVVYIVLIVIQSLIGAILTSKKHRQKQNQVERAQTPEPQPQVVIPQKPKAKLSIT